MRKFLYSVLALLMAANLAPTLNARAESLTVENILSKNLGLITGSVKGAPTEDCALEIGVRENGFTVSAGFREYSLFMIFPDGHWELDPARNSIKIYDDYGLPTDFLVLRFDPHSLRIQSFTHFESDKDRTCLF